jgi:hypothetical protein
MNDWDSMSSLGLLVSNIVSSFIIVNHPLFGISYTILNKNSGVSSGNGSRQSKSRAAPASLTPKSGAREEGYGANSSLSELINASLRWSEATTALERLIRPAPQKSTLLFNDEDR